MKIFKRIIIVVVGLFAILLIGGYLLPSTVSLSREITIAAPAEKIFPHINDLKKFQAWSPWAQLDPNMKMVFSGSPSGKGQKSSWQSEKSDVGSGSQEITASALNKRVATKLDFGEMGTATAEWDLTPNALGTNGQGGNALGTNALGTKVTWSFQTDLGDNPLMRWMGLMFDNMVGSDYEAGLAKLKALVEAEK